MHIQEEIQLQDQIIPVLIVDDNPFDQLILQKAMEKENIKIHLANSANEALYFLKKEEIGLVICDISMPELNGFDFLKIIKEHKRFNSIPFVFYSTSQETDELSEEAFGLGASDFLSKELSPIKLKNRLKALIKQAETNYNIEKAFQQLKKQNQEDKRLLSKMIPKKALDQLSVSGNEKHVIYSNVAVMFSDFASYTKLSKEIDLSLLVAKLNTYFTEFDYVIQKYGIQKIKTIGDSYMAASGILSENENSTILAVCCAIEMKHLVNEIAKKEKYHGLNPWYIKFGIAVGDVVGGVIGQESIIFDIWGDTVNLASRLEGVSTKNSIIVSKEVNEAVKEYFITENRGIKDLKNYGEVEVYEVTSFKPEYSQDSEGQVPNKAFFKSVNF